ncbi:MAG: ATP-dependent zinc metalloprotease FtsH [Planctomycetes bacterium]|nr:ATP-dependent zinc metalloprotease FtsH [Planctomycetota bacterium]
MRIDYVQTSGGSEGEDSTNTAAAIGAQAIVRAVSRDSGGDDAKSKARKRPESPQRRPGESGPGNDKKAPGQAPPPSRGMFGAVSLLLLGLIIFMMVNSPGSGRKITLDEFKSLYNSQQLLDGSVVIREDAVMAKRVQGPDSPTMSVVSIPLNSPAGKAVAEEVIKITGGKASVQRASEWTQFLLFFGPFILLIAFVWFVISRAMRGGGPGAGMLGSFGKSRHRTLNKEMTGVTFADVAGIDEAKDEVQEIIEFLKNPKKFARLGGRIPRGVLLIGEPGCGKTLLAKAIAGEADVPFFSISGSDFVEMFVGVGASRVRDLFRQAKDSSPCIIFLDEIDAVGRRRGSGFTTGGHDEREQTLNAILVEMDGFTPSDGVIVIAATNRADVLDPALIRPGRFDRQVTVPLPDVAGRLEILRVHAKKVKLGDDVNLEKIARGTPMFSGADLAAIINEAAISATMQNKDCVEHVDMEEARDKVKFGRSKKSRVRDKEESRLVAYHEAGHAVLQAMLPDADPLHKVTIIPRGGTGGATFGLPEKDRMGYGVKWLIAQMRICCGGRIAEEKAVGDVSSGASMDIAQVTRIARSMVEEWGMSPKLGFVRYAGSDTREMYMPEKDYSDETASTIDDEVRRLADEAYTEARRLLEENWEKVVAVAEALLKYETLTGEEVERLMRGEQLTRPVLTEDLKAQARRNAAKEVVQRLDAADSPDLPPGALPRPA